MGLCSRHYQQIRHHGRLTPEREYRPRGEVCSVSGCRNPQIARGLCHRHYQQVRRHGRLTPEREHRVRQLADKGSNKQRRNA